MGDVPRRWSVDQPLEKPASQSRFVRDRRTNRQHRHRESGGDALRQIAEPRGGSAGRSEDDQIGPGGEFIQDRKEVGGANHPAGGCRLGDVSQLGVIRPDRIGFRIRSSFAEHVAQAERRSRAFGDPVSQGDLGYIGRSAGAHNGDRRRSLQSPVVIEQDRAIGVFAKPPNVVDIRSGAPRERGQLNEDQIRVLPVKVPDSK